MRNPFVEYNNKKYIIAHIRSIEIDKQTYKIHVSTQSGSFIIKSQDLATAEMKYVALQARITAFYNYIPILETTDQKLIEEMVEKGILCK